MIFEGTLGIQRMIVGRAVTGLVRAVGVEFGSADVRANVIAPGVIATAQSLDEVSSAGPHRLEADAHGQRGLA